LQKDILALLQNIKWNYPLFIYAHSYSASIILSLLINNPFLKIAGLILWSPQLGSKIDNKKWFNKLIDKYSGNYVLSWSIDPSYLTKD